MNTVIKQLGAWMGALALGLVVSVAAAQTSAVDANSKTPVSKAGPPDAQSLPAPHANERPKYKQSDWQTIRNIFCREYPWTCALNISTLSPGQADVLQRAGDMKDAKLQKQYLENNKAFLLKPDTAGEPTAKRAPPIPVRGQP